MMVAPFGQSGDLVQRGQRHFMRRPAQIERTIARTARRHQFRHHS
jgi:hypothetical protein